MIINKNKIVRSTGAAFLLACIIAVAGCFDEPVPAYKTVPEAARVYLQDKGLKDLSSCKDVLKAEIVDYVNLDRNELTNVNAIASFTNLKWLRLNNNRLSSLPDLSRLISLKRIYLKGNAFKEVPSTLKDLPALTDIELSWNPVKEVPEWLAKREGLENISLTHTEIKSLPSDLSAWRSLKSLQLGDLKLSLEEMKRIRKALPDTTIVF